MFGKNLLRELCYAAPLIFFLLGCFLVQSCDSLTVSNSSTGDVNGRIYGMNNAFLSDYKVTVAGTTVITDNYGRFSFTGVEYPYDLVIYDSIGKKCAFYPKRDSITKENLSIGILSSSYNMLHSVISVSYPAGTVSGSGKMIFTDNSDKNFYGTLSHTGGEIELDMSYGTQYNGKIIALTYTADNAGRIVSYEKYCIKDNIVLTAGVNFNVDLTPQDFKTGILNKKYRMNFFMLPNQNTEIRYAYISFGKKFTYNDLKISAFEILHSNSFELVVPDGFGLNCYPIAGFDTKQNTGSVCFSSVFDVACGDMTISPPQTPVPVYPPENASVNLNTEFVFNLGLDRVTNKFYKVNFFNISGAQTNCLYYDVYLEKERFSVSELNNLGIDNIKGCSFMWSVEVYENINLNDYIRENYSGNKRFMTECVKRKVTINP